MAVPIPTANPYRVQAPANPYATGLQNARSMINPAMSMFGNNSTALMMAGLGMLGGGNPQQQWQNAASGLATGMAFDTARRDRAEQKQEREASRNATLEYLRSTGRYSDDQLNAASGSPQVMNALLEQSFQAPKERRIMEDKTGRRRYVDTGEYVFQDVQAQPEFAKDQISAANALRDDLNRDLATANLVQDGATTIQTLYKNPGAVSDYALAVAFAKIVDPGSVAREGEVAAVQSAGARFPQYLQSLKNAITGEGAMNPEMRREIAELSAEMANQKITSAQTTLGNYKTATQQMGVPFNWVYQGSGFTPIEKPAPLVEPPATAPPASVMTTPQLPAGAPTANVQAPMTAVQKRRARRKQQQINQTPLPPGSKLTYNPATGQLE